MDDGFGPNGRTMCDRIIRACNQRLGSGTVDPAHQEKIVELVELAVQGFESLEESGNAKQFILSGKNCLPQPTESHQPWSSRPCLSIGPTYVQKTKAFLCRGTMCLMTVSPRS